MADTAALASTDTSAAMPVSRELGHSYLRLGLGLGLFLPAHFLQQGSLRFWVAGWGG
jgi:hypothetical protein